MPYVRLKYQIKLDATVNLFKLKFQSIPFFPKDLKGNDILPQDILYVTDTLLINMTLAQFGQWKLNVWVMQLDPNDEYSPVGGWKPLVDNDTAKFTNDANIQNNLNGNFQILW